MSTPTPTPTPTPVTETTRKIYIATTSTLEDAERLLDTLISQTHAMRVQQLAFLRVLEDLLALHSIKYQDPPPWVYAMEPKDGKFKIWRLESAPTQEEQG